jgi:hypothetical protein
MIRVFVSYASADSQAVDEIRSDLMAVGYKICSDRTTITGGEMWRARVVEEIEASDVFLLALSPSSVKSRRVLQELNIADGEGKPILPVVIAPVAIPKEMKLQLSGLQKVSLATDDLSNMNTLYKSINQLVDSKSNTTSPEY